MTTTDIRLPEAFTARVREQLQDEFQAFLDSYARPARQALRVNTLKISVEGLQKLLPFLTESVPGTEDCFFYPEDARPGLSPYHEAGLYYIQEPSAMLASRALAARPGERVLDLCAAPGGKTTAIAADMKGEGLLIANEIIPKRAAVLSQNVERLGITNTVVTNHAPVELAERFPACFDRILVDAPCSGEGMFKKEPQALEMWSPENIAACAARQDQILAEADKMLRPGGRLVYSTCTFAPSEDADCVSRFLAAHPDYALLSQETLWPHRFPGEGQFIAVLEKGDTGTVLLSSIPDMGTVLLSPFLKPSKKDLAALRPWQDFAEHFFAEFPFFAKKMTEEPSPCHFFGDHLYLLPQPLDLKGLKVLRPGLHLGTVEKNRFVPSHSLALALDPAQTANVLNLSQHQACSWTEGLSIPCDNAPGWCLVCVDGRSLGFGKVSGGQCKNHYPKGLRRKTIEI